MTFHVSLVSQIPLPSSKGTVLRHTDDNWPKCFGKPQILNPNIVNVSLTHRNTADLVFG